ncbi:hypothetical protein M728_005726 (plasmid) [Ensifer sp. WSM1721]
MERLTMLLNDVRLSVSKRQVVRLVTKGLDGFDAEDAAELNAGLVSAIRRPPSRTHKRFSRVRTGRAAPVTSRTTDLWVAGR